MGEWNQEIFFFGKRYLQSKKNLFFIFYFVVFSLCMLFLSNYVWLLNVHSDETDYYYFFVVQYWRTERKKLQKQKNSVRSLFFLNCFVMGGLSYKSEKEIFFATEISNERREKILFSPHTNSSISLLCLIFMYYEWIFWRILLWSAQIMYHSSYIHQLFITDKKKKKRKIVVEIMNFTWIEGCLTNHFGRR